MFFTLLAGFLLWKQRVVLGRLLFVGIALAWLTPWIGFSALMLPERELVFIDRTQMVERLTINPLKLFNEAEAWLFHAFFLLPALLAAGMAWMAGRGGARR